MAGPPNSISVAMATFQGEKFLREQLESIAAQNLRPSELVVFDDASTDGTVSIIEKFARRASFPIQLHMNEHRKGASRNFSDAIGATNGTIIALCDQDDVWTPTKLEVIESVFDVSPEIGAVFSDAELVGEDLHSLGRTHLQAMRFSRREAKAFRENREFDVLLRRNVVAGATLAFRSSFKDLILPIPDWGVHDLWIALLVSAVSRLQLLSHSLMYYRQHAGNKIGSPFTGPLDRAEMRNLYPDTYEHQVRQHEEALERLREHYGDALPRWVSSGLKEKIKHAEFRRDLPRSPMYRVLGVLREAALLRYQKYSAGPRSVAYDLVLRRTPP